METAAPLAWIYRASIACTGKHRRVAQHGRLDPAGDLFYAIRRFDRPDGGRIHVEDFARVFNLRTHQSMDESITT